MIEWIELHYKLITGIAVPIIIAVTGIFKIRKMLKNHAKGNNNIQIIAEKDVDNDNSFNTTSQIGHTGIQVLGNNNQVNNLDLYPSVPGHVRQKLGIIKYMRAVRKPTSCQYQAKVSRA